MSADLQRDAFVALCRASRGWQPAVRSLCVEAGFDTRLHVEGVRSMLGDEREGVVALGVGHDWRGLAPISEALVRRVEHGLAAALGEPRGRWAVVHWRGDGLNPGHAIVVLVYASRSPSPGPNVADGGPAPVPPGDGKHDVPLERAVLRGSPCPELVGDWSAETLRLPVLERHGYAATGLSPPLAVDGRLTVLGAMLHGSQPLLDLLPGLAVAFREHDFELETVAALDLLTPAVRWSDHATRHLERWASIARRWCHGLPSADAAAEALIEFGRNALAHRAIAALPVGAHGVEIDVYPDAVVIANDGAPPPAFVSGEDGSLQRRRPRNPLLYAALQGDPSVLHGHAAAVAACVASGLHVEHLTEHDRTVVFVTRPAHLATPSPLGAPERSVPQPPALSGARARLADALTHEPKSTRELAATLGMAPSTARAHLAALVAGGHAVATDANPNAPNRRYVRAPAAR